eukprot:jgi/Mesen1/9037/ME000566S08453
MEMQWREGGEGGLSREQMDDIREQFSVLDANGSGSIDEGELLTAMKALGFAPSPEEFKTLFQNMDMDGDGMVSFEEYLDFMTGTVRLANFRSDAMRLFYVFVDPRTGKISRRTLQRGAQLVGEEFDEYELMDMFDAADVQRDGEIDEEEFIAMVRRTGVLS